MPLKQNQREYRNLAQMLPVTDQKRLNSDYYIEGYATTWEPYVLWEYDGIKYYEVIDRNAFAGADMSDIIMQYDHQGLAPLWNLVEAALLAPDAVEWLDAGAEPLLRLEHGEVRMALFDPAGWCVHYRHGQGDCDRLQRVYDHFMARQRQFAAVLEAHGIPVLFVHCDGQDDARALLAA